MRTKILTDTTCDLSKERRDALDITALPLHVMLGGVDHRDGVDVTQEQLFAYAQEHKQLPKTAALSVAEFQSVFIETFESGYDEMVYTGLSSKLSSTFQNALLARDGLREAGYDPARVHIVDSKQLSSGIAHLLLRGAEILQQGGSAQEVEEDMLRTVPKLSTSFVVDTLQYLHMGGRCSSVAYLAGSMLKLHPQINMVDGAMIAGEKFRGKLDHCIQLYKQRVVLDQLDHIEPHRIFVTTTMAPERAERLADEIRELHFFDEVLVESAGATISSHCGPDTMGYLTIHKD